MENDDIKATIRAQKGILKLQLSEISMIISEYFITATVHVHWSRQESNMIEVIILNR
jgi:hypothetical protein